MVMAAFIRGKPRFVDYDPGATVVHAGDVIVFGGLACVAHVDIPAFTGAKTLDALAIGGGEYEMTADAGTYPIGTFMFWLPSSSKVVGATASGAVPFGPIVGGAAHRLSDAPGTTVTVAHDPEAAGAMSLMAASGPDVVEGKHKHSATPEAEPEAAEGKHKHGATPAHEKAAEVKHSHR